MHALAILIMLLRHFSSLITVLWYFYEIQFRPGVNELLYLIIVLLNSLLENDSHVDICFDGISSKTSGFIHWSWAELKV